MKKRGFTLIELMVVIFIVAILLSILIGGAATSKHGSNLSYGWNGMTETRCIDGFKFILGHNARPVQVLDENGHGIPCTRN